MGKGTDAARRAAPEHAQLIDDLKDQLLIAFLRRLGGQCLIPVKEVDETGRYNLTLQVVETPAGGKAMRFTLQGKG